MEKKVLYTAGGIPVTVTRKKSKKKLRTVFTEKHWVEFSKIIVTLVMLTYFAMVIVGIVDGAVRGADFLSILEFVKEHTVPVLIGYFAKAFGENIFKQLLSWQGNKQNEEGE